MILRDRDTCPSEGADGTLDERVYDLQNWRADVVALIADDGSQIEQDHYEPYGTPFGIPAGDTDGDGDVDQTDLDQVTTWRNASTYDVRGDLDMDDDVDLADENLVKAAKNNGDTLGRNNLSLVDNRKGYAGYELLSELTESKWDVRNRVLNSELGRWNRRDPLGYVDGMSLYAYADSLLGGNDSYGLCSGCVSSSQPEGPFTTPPLTLIPRDLISPALIPCLADPVTLRLFWDAVGSCGASSMRIRCSSDGSNKTNCDCSSSGNTADLQIDCLGPDKCSILRHELTHVRQCCDDDPDDATPGFCDLSPDTCLALEMEAYQAQGECGEPPDVLWQFDPYHRCLCGRACDSCMGNYPFNWLDREQCINDCLGIDFPINPGDDGGPPDLWGGGGGKA